MFGPTSIPSAQSLQNVVISRLARHTPVSRRVLLNLSVLESEHRIEIAGNAWFLKELQTQICSDSTKMFANFLKLWRDVIEIACVAQTFGVVWLQNGRKKCRFFFLQDEARRDGG